MRHRGLVLFWVVWAGWIAPLARSAPPPDRPLQEGPIRVLVVTGGHPFEEATFFGMFDSMKDVQIERATVPKDAARLSPALADRFDVIVLYDMWTRGITSQQRKAFLALLERGIGVCALHHTLASHQDWPEYEKILGGKYYSNPSLAGVPDRPRSTALHDQDIRVHIADRSHPITRDLGDFTIHDETYHGYDVSPLVHPLLVTDHPKSERQLAWVHAYANSRVFYLQLGHDRHAYDHPLYRKIVHRAIRWCAGRPTDPRQPARALWNGRNLDGWEVSGGAVWEVRDGVLVGRQGPGNQAGDLFTKETFDDFELRVTYRITWPANSGIWYRYRSPKEAYQADILEFRDPRAFSGSLYRPGKLFLAINDDPTLVNREGWNTIVVRAFGPRHVIFLNGKKVADVREGTVRRGRIGFQIHAGKEFGRMRIEIRQATIRPL